MLSAPSNINLNQLRKLPPNKLISTAQKMNIEIDNVQPKDLINVIVSNAIKNNMPVEMEGILEMSLFEKI